MNSMIIRVEASPATGFGHAMRCLALAQAASEDGWEAKMVYHACSDGILSRYRDAKVELIQYNGEMHGKADGEFVSGLRADWVISDGYDFRTSFYKVALQHSRLMCIDDYGRPEVCIADAILNQNPSAKSSWYTNRASSSHLFLGESFALLRREFRNSKQRVGREEIRKILITTGGGHKSDLPQLLVESVSSILPKSVSIMVILAKNEHYESIGETFFNTSNVSCLFGVDNMAEILSDVDLVITGAGATVWECLAMGVPFITMTLADNQMLNADYLSKNNFAISVGDYKSKGFTERVMQAAAEHIRHPEKARVAALRGQSLIDGRGPSRIINSLSE